MTAAHLHAWDIDNISICDIRFEMILDTRFAKLMLTIEAKKLGHFDFLVANITIFAFFIFWRFT
jgi:hypothetical protein